MNCLSNDTLQSYVCHWLIGLKWLWRELLKRCDFCDAECIINSINTIFALETVFVFHFEQITRTSACLEIFSSTKILPRARTRQYYWQYPCLPPILTWQNQNFWIIYNIIEQYRNTGRTHTILLTIRTLLTILLSVCG